MFIAFCAKGVWFNGERLSFGDMQAQYNAMLIYFRKVILGKESIFYSITKGLGGDMYATSTYYMLSPFNFIVLLFKESNIMQAIYFIILGKIGTSGLTSYIFFKSKDKDDIKCIIFSICYALMAFVVNSYFCIMWLDSVYMAPLILLGLDRLIDNNDQKLYILTLSLSLLFNFYMGYMTCIFTLIYFIYKIVNKYKLEDKILIKKNVFNYLLSTLLSGLITSFIWLPSIIELLKTSRSGVGTSTTIITTLKTIFIGSYSEESMLNYYQPNLYCGIIVLVLLLSFFMSKRNSNVKKGTSLVVIGIFIASILIDFLSYVWHGFSYPIGYNYRFAFLFCLFLIILAFEEYCTLEFFKKRQQFILWIAGILMLIFQVVSFDKAWISVIFLILYGILMSININFDVRKYLLLILVIIEFSINTVLSFFPAYNGTTLDEYYKDICKNIDSSDSYRISGYDFYGIDEVISCSKSSTKGFYSTINNNIVKFYGKIGWSGGANVYDDNQNNTPIVSSLLGVKTVYDQYRHNDLEFIKEFKTKKYDPNGNVYYETINYLYNNNEALTLGYMIDDVKKINNLNVFEYQNELLKSLSGNKNDILKLIHNNGKNEKLRDSKYIYLFAQSENSIISIDNVQYRPINIGEMFKVENNFNSDEIIIESDGDILAYYIDNDEYIKSINKLKEQQLSNINIDKNVISGKINVKEEGTLMLTIPYEDGINVYIDGKKVKFDKIYDMFIGVNVNKGKHTVKVIYKTSTYIYGVLASLMALIITILYIKETNKENKNEKTRKKVQ